MYLAFALAASRATWPKASLPMTLADVVEE